METEHTKGPWKIVPDKKLNGWLITNPSKKVCMALGGGEECSVFVTDKEALANAKLIAAAPELLEACESINNFRAATERGNTDPDTVTDYWDSVMGIVQAAIAKATE